jgi:HEPN domain-containing protein
MGESPRRDQGVIAAYLEEVAEDLDAARRLLEPPPNRFAAFHLQQAAEKLVKAVRLHRGLQATKEHNLEVLINELPEGDPWRERLTELEFLSAFATAYRYPTPNKGWRNPGPSAEVSLRTVDAIAAHLAAVRKELLGS